MTQFRETYRWEQPMKSSARLMVWLLLLLVLAVTFWAYFAKVRVYVIVRGLLVPQRQAVQVSAPTAGRIIDSRLKLWKKFKKGEVLYVLDTVGRDTTDTSLQSDMQRNAIAQAKANLAIAKADYNNRKESERRIRSVYEIGGIPRSDLDSAVLAVRSAEAQLQRTRADLKTAQTRLKMLDRNQKVKVRAPIDGQIMQMADLYVGQVVSASQSNLQILPEGVSLIFRGNAPEQDRPKLLKGARVQIAWNGYPRQKYGVTVGSLAAVSPTSSVAGAGAVANTGNLGPPQYEIEVSFPQPDTGPPTLNGKPLYTGLAGEARVQSEERTMMNLFWEWLRGLDPWD